MPTWLGTAVPHWTACAGCRRRGTPSAPLCEPGSPRLPLPIHNCIMAYISVLFYFTYLFTPHRLGGKNVFWDWLWTLTKHITAAEHYINNRKETCQSTGLLCILPNSVNFGLETAENGWRVFAHPLNVCIGRLHGHYITDSRQTLTHVM